MSVDVEQAMATWEEKLYDVATLAQIVRAVLHGQNYSESGKRARAAAQHTKGETCTQEQ